MVVIDEIGSIVSFSAAAEKLFGYAEIEVIGKNVKMLMPSPDRERHDRYLLNYRTTGKRKIIGIGRVTTALHRDGNTFPIELSIGEARIGEHRIFTGFIRDLTEQQQTASSAPGSSVGSWRMSARLSEMGTLASSLAHELNQPLTAVASYCESARDLLQTNLTQNARDGARSAGRSGDQAIRAGQIVRRLRDFMSHGETDRRPRACSADQRSQRAGACRLA